MHQSVWVTVDQARIDQFADATDDHQWIHLDAARAADGPFGACIAHGFMTLALIEHCVEDFAATPAGVGFSVEAYSRIRFLTPVIVGSELKVKLEMKGRNGSGITVQASVEIRDAKKPACVADIRLRRP